MLASRPLGVTRLRHMPKLHGMRPVANLSSKTAVRVPRHVREPRQRRPGRRDRPDGTPAHPICIDTEPLTTQQHSMHVLPHLQPAAAPLPPSLAFEPINRVLQPLHAVLKSEAQRAAHGSAPATTPDWQRAGSHPYHAPIGYLTMRVALLHLTAERRGDAWPMLLSPCRTAEHGLAEHDVRPARRRMAMHTRLRRLRRDRSDRRCTWPRTAMPVLQQRESGRVRRVNVTRICAHPVRTLTSHACTRLRVQCARPAGRPLPLPLTAHLRPRTAAFFPGRCRRSQTHTGGCGSLRRRGGPPAGRR